VARVARAARDGLPDAVWKALRRRLPGRTRAWGHDHARGYADLDVAATLAVRVPLYEGWDGVQVQVRGREPGGIVDPRDLDLVLARVSDALLGIVDERGERCVMAVERREALWPGGDPRRTPDLAVTLRADCAGGDRMGEGAIVEQRSRPAGAGSHRRDGIVALAGPAVRQGASLIEPGVEDIGLTWLAMAGIPLPPGRDGRALTEALTVELAAPAPTPAAPAPTAIAVDAEALHAQLRALGYLDG
jgi:predicted AlkP superfamily phosphohydrolase/phosphomutase